jgi:hypothetical protein
MRTKPNRNLLMQVNVHFPLLKDCTKITEQKLMRTDHE